MPGRRVYASGSGSVGDRSGWRQTAQKMGPADQLAREGADLARARAFGGDAAVVVFAAIGAGPADAPAMRHKVVADSRFSRHSSGR
jgi:hypothetical protein